MENQSTELSVIGSSVNDAVARGEYGEAMTLLAASWREAEPVGFRPCTLAEWPDIWVRFRVRGYPYSLARRWLAMNERDTVETVLSYIEEWNLTDYNNAPILLPDGERKLELLDDLEDQLVAWLVREFTIFWQRDLRSGGRKNSLAPSRSS